MMLKGKFEIEQKKMYIYIYNKKDTFLINKIYKKRERTKDRSVKGFQTEKFLVQAVKCLNATPEPESLL